MKTMTGRTAGATGARKRSTSSMFIMAPGVGAPRRRRGRGVAELLYAWESNTFQPAFARVSRLGSLGGNLSATRLATDRFRHRFRRVRPPSSHLSIDGSPAAQTM